MSLNVNHVILAGNLTRDPEVRTLANERAVAHFSLAVNRRWKTPDGEQKEEVTFVDCEAWGRTGEIIGQYLTKGSPCYIEGRLKLDQWTDQATGQKRSRIKVVAESMQFVGARQRAEAGGGEEAPAVDAAPAARPAARRPALAASPATGAPGEDEPPF